jgi:formylglycine-generating enzyme required for sulfatase activity
MDQRDKEIITNKTSLTTQPGGLASRGLQIANKLTEQNAKTVKQLIDEKYFTNSLGMKLVLIPEGRFQMGAPIGEMDECEDELQHDVTISQNYYLGMTQVTQGQYEKVMGDNPSRFQGCEVDGRDSSAFPVEQVSWDDVVEFCKKLSELPEEKKSGRVYRLPTEAEWEYACRAGSNTAYCFGNNEESLCDYAWFEDNSGYQTHPVGEKKPNAWGLYDMHGNVWELCSDWYDYYIEGAVIDPSGPSEGRFSRQLYYGVAPIDPSHPPDGPYRVYRGGCNGCEAKYCRSACRYGEDPSERREDLGFRVAMNFSGIPKLPERDK